MSINYLVVVLFFNFLFLRLFDAPKIREFLNVANLSSKKQ